MYIDGHVPVLDMSDGVGNFGMGPGLANREGVLQQ